jgi:protease II
MNYKRRIPVPVPGLIFWTLWKVLYATLKARKIPQKQFRKHLKQKRKNSLFVQEGDDSDWTMEEEKEWSHQVFLIFLSAPICDG